MNIGKYMDACVFIVCIFALLQYIMRDKPFWGDLLGGLIYNNIEGNMAYWDNDRRLFATFFEPSYCGMFLSASFWYYVEKKRVVFSTVLFLLVVFFNKSTTGYVVLFVGFLIWIIVHGNAREYLPYLIMGFVMILVIALSPIGETIRFNIVDKITVRASGQLRKSWDVECIRVLTETHFWGAGYGISRGNSGVATILANLGIEGLLLWLIALWKLIYKPMPWQDEGERVFLIVALVGIFASCPDLSMTIFWMGVIITLYSKAIEDRYAEELKIYADNKRLCFNNGKQ